MEAELVEVKIVRAIKTKTGKTMLTFSIPDDDTSYSKGNAIIEQWYDTDKVFSKIKSEYIDIPLLTSFRYEKTYRGMARLVITDLFDLDGNNILV